MPARFHAYSNCNSSTPKLTIEAFSFFSILQTPFLKLTTFSIYTRYLLKLGVKIYSYNDHVRSFLPSLWLGLHHRSLLGNWSRHCHEINSTQNPRTKANDLVEPGVYAV